MSARSGVRAAAVALVVVTAGCGPITPDPRVPVPVPFPAVEGATPAVGSGVMLGLSFGDGFWGQERERAELVGFGAGLALFDMVELDYHSYSSNRSVDDEAGVPDSGSGSTTVRAKVKVRESTDGAWAFGVVGAWSSASRFVPDVQDDDVGSLDLAFPAEYRIWLEPDGRSKIALYGAPRFTWQSFESSLGTAPAPLEDSGVAWGGLLGLKARLGWLHLSGEGSLVRGPRMEVGGFGTEAGWMVIPALSARLVIPIGEGSGSE